MCSTVFERKQVWGAHLSLLGQELYPILTTNQQLQHKASNKSLITTSSEYMQLLFWSGTKGTLRWTDEAQICRCAEMCITAPLENNQGRSVVLPPPPYSKLPSPRQALLIPFQDASHSFSSTTDIPPSPKHSLIWSKSLTGVLNLVFLCGRDNIFRKHFICIRGDD